MTSTTHLLLLVATASTLNSIALSLYRINNQRSQPAPPSQPLDCNTFVAEANQLASRDEASRYQESHRLLKDFYAYYPEPSADPAYFHTSAACLSLLRHVCQHDFGKDPELPHEITDSIIKKYQKIKYYLSEDLALLDQSSPAAQYYITIEKHAATLKEKSKIIQQELREFASLINEKMKRLRDYAAHPKPVPLIPTHFFLQGDESPVEQALRILREYNEPHWYRNHHHQKYATYLIQKLEACLPALDANTGLRLPLTEDLLTQAMHHVDEIRQIMIIEAEADGATLDGHIRRGSQFFNRLNMVTEKVLKPACEQFNEHQYQPPALRG